MSHVPELDSGVRFIICVWDEDTRSYTAHPKAPPVVCKDANEVEAI